MSITCAIVLAICIFELVAVGKIFKKAGEKGWKAIIPFYNTYILYKISGRRIWFWVLVLCWVLTIIFYCGTYEFENSIGGIIMTTFCGAYLLISFILPIMMMHRISKSFGHGAAFTLGLLFLSFIFYPILGFGNSEYKRLEDYDC